MQDCSVVRPGDSAGLYCVTISDSMGVPNPGDHIVQFQVPPLYPFELPSLQFVTPISIPYVDWTGLVDMTWLSVECPRVDMATVLRGVQVFLGHDQHSPGLGSRVLLRNSWYFTPPVYLIELDQSSREYLLARAYEIDAWEDSNVPDPGATNGLHCERSTHALHMLDMLRSDMPIGEICDDLDFILTLVTHRGSDLKYGSLKLRNNRGVVLAAVRNDGSSLQYAADELRRDFRVAVEAVQRQRSAMSFVDASLRNDREFAFAVASRDPLARLRG
uniref:DUF4116 domain-containing protein n=1 Tax=Zooxanthella nutricula TaxID=1333877 RepID=A0A7S2LBR5_9DINO